VFPPAISPLIPLFFTCATKFPDCHCFFFPPQLVCSFFYLVYSWCFYTRYIVLRLHAQSESRPITLSLSVSETGMGSKPVSCADKRFFLLPYPNPACHTSSFLYQDHSPLQLFFPRSDSRRPPLPKRNKNLLPQSVSPLYAFPFVLQFVTTTIPTFSQHQWSPQSPGGFGSTDADHFPDRFAKAHQQVHNLRRPDFKVYVGPGGTVVSKRAAPSLYRFYLYRPHASIFTLGSLDSIV